MDAMTSDLLADKLSLLGYDGLAEDLNDQETTVYFQDAKEHLDSNRIMLDDPEDWEAYYKARHEIVMAYKYGHNTENLLYDAGGSNYWSLFRTSSDQVAIYFHVTDEFKIMPEKSKYIELNNIADNYDAATNTINF